MDDTIRRALAVQSGLATKNFTSGGHRTKTGRRCEAAIIILPLMGENNPPHRKSMEHAAKFAILDSSASSRHSKACAR